MRINLVYASSISLVRLIGNLTRNAPIVQGKNHIPAAGSFILVANHTSIVDPYHISWYFSFREPIRWFAKKESVSGKELAKDFTNLGFLAKIAAMIVAWSLRASAVIPVDRENPTSRMNGEALMAAKKHLEQGGIIGIFPEGGVKRRNSNGISKSFAMLARITGSPVLPVYCGPGIVSIGEPRQFSANYDYESFAREIMASVYKLEDFHKEDLRVAHQTWPS